MYKAILFLLEGEKTVAEGAGSAGIAALLSGKIHGIEGKKVATIVSGGNIDVNAIPWVIEAGLLESKRRIRFSMDLPDRPGSLGVLINHISASLANVYATISLSHPSSLSSPLPPPLLSRRVNVHHERTSMVSFGAARVMMTLDVRDAAHGQEIIENLKKIYKDNNTIKVEER